MECSQDFLKILAPHILCACTSTRFIVTNYPHFEVAVFFFFLRFSKNFCGGVDLTIVAIFSFVLFNENKERKNVAYIVCVCNFFVFKAIHSLKVIKRRSKSKKKTDNERFKSKKFSRNFHKFQRKIILMRLTKKAN